VQHIDLAVSPHPPTALATTCTLSGACRRGGQHEQDLHSGNSDWFDGEFGIPLLTRAAPFPASPRSELLPCLRGGPGGGQLALLAHSPSPLASWAPPRSLGLLAPLRLPTAARCWRGKGTKETVRELLMATGKSRGSSAQFGGITETIPDLEDVGPRGPKAARERNSPFTHTCRTMPDFLKMLGDEQRMSLKLFLFSKLSHSWKSQISIFC